MARLGYGDPTPGAIELTLSGTATGYSADWIQYDRGYQQFGLLTWSTGSTKGTTGNWRLMGAVGTTSVWAALMAADNPTTGTGNAALINTTAGLVVDRVILTSTSMSASSTETGFVLTAWIVPLSGG